LLKVNEAAARLNVSLSTLWRWIRLGDITVFQHGATVRIPEESLQEFTRRGYAVSERGRVRIENKGFPIQAKGQTFIDQARARRGVLPEQINNRCLGGN
jgi:excisionase family DNA binding protein